VGIYAKNPIPLSVTTWKKPNRQESYCWGRLVCQVSTGWLSQHSMADANKKLNPSHKIPVWWFFFFWKGGRRGRVRSIGGGAPLLNWMPLDWLQEGLYTPSTIGFRWGGTEVEGRTERLQGSSSARRVNVCVCVSVCVCVGGDTVCSQWREGESNSRVWSVRYNTVHVTLCQQVAFFSPFFFFFTLCAFCVRFRDTAGKRGIPWTDINTTNVWQVAIIAFNLFWNQKKITVFK
jgi:hypothetical protein